MNKDRWQEISRLYYAALELSEDEREPLLNRCEDEDLRREVLSLLADKSLARSFLEKPALDVATRLGTNKRQSLVGSQLGAYKVVSELGSGGMGDVYKAKDTKLGRHVAIKVLSDEFARDDLRLNRFRREAKLLASLSHPNIAAIHGLEESGDTHYLILELIEGDTLAELIERGPIPVGEAIKLALQITEALEVAHGKGVIHRDLKPDNIKVTPEFKVKVLDFGLAKAYAADAPDANLTDLSATSSSDTLQGVILGTASYMSPEQARGKPVDKRTDIWAFGCVLYEMLTGHAAFPGRDTTEILAAVIRAEPDWSCLPANLHWRLHEVLERCLEKEKKDRYGAISDVRADIQKTLTDPGMAPVHHARVAENRAKLRLGIPWIAAIFVLGSILGAVAVWKREPPPPQGKEQPVAFVQELPEGSQINVDLQWQGGTLAVSEDGRQIVCSTNKGFYLRSLGETELHRIEGTDGNSKTPFFSYDGNWIGYWCATEGKLKRINLHGGSPIPICDVTYVAGAIWDRDHGIIYSDIDTGILRVSDRAGTPAVLAKGILSTPQLLPGINSILFTQTFTRLGKWIKVKSLDSEQSEELFFGRSARYLSSGHIVYILGTDLIFAPFDLQKLEITGKTNTLAHEVGSYAISESTLVYRPPTDPSNRYTRRLAWVNLAGEEVTLGELPPETYLNLRISPDGNKVAFSSGIGDNPRTLDIHVWDMASKTLKELTSNENPDNFPIWYNDEFVIYWSRGENPGIYRKRADGDGEAEMLCSTSKDPLVPLIPYSFSRDGNILLIVKIFGDGFKNQDVLALSLDGKHTPVPLLQENYIETLPRISPNGRWMAYASRKTGEFEIYVSPFPNAAEDAQKISTDGGYSPLWSPDGTKLFYLSGDAAMAVSVNTEKDFSCGKPRILFQKAYLKNWPEELGTPWDLHPDGDRFLILKSVEKVDPKSALEELNSFKVVENWREELKQRVPAN